MTTLILPFSINSLPHLARTPEHHAFLAGRHKIFTCSRIPAFPFRLLFYRERTNPGDQNILSRCKGVLYDGNGAFTRMTNISNNVKTPYLLVA